MQTMTGNLILSGKKKQICDSLKLLLRSFDAAMRSNSRNPHICREIPPVLYSSEVLSIYRFAILTGTYGWIHFLQIFSKPTIVVKYFDCPVNHSLSRSLQTKIQIPWWNHSTSEIQILIWTRIKDDVNSDSLVSTEIWWKDNSLQTISYQLPIPWAILIFIGYQKQASHLSWLSPGLMAMKGSSNYVKILIRLKVVSFHITPSKYFCRTNFI